MSFFAELKRRNVIRVAVAYLVAAWLLAQVTSLVAVAFGAPDWVMKMLIALLAIGFVPVLFFSWVYELTPEGLRKESDVRPDESITTDTAKKLDVTVIVLLVGAIGLFAIDRFLLNRGSEAAPAEKIVGTEVTEAVTAPETALALGVAVLLFDNLSPDPDNAFFAAGVHDDVLTYLSRIAALRVISRTSVKRYTGSGLSVPEIGRELGVSHVMEGTVRRAKGRVLVKVHLIDALTDDTVWGEDYNRSLEDTLGIQSEIAQAVVAEVEAELTSKEAASLAKIPTTSTEAYDEYLRGLERKNAQTVSSTWGDYDSDGISEHFLRATELDPDFIGAWLMTMQVSSAAVWFNRDPDGQHLQHVRDALARIKTLGPDSPESDRATGFYEYYITRDLAAAFAAFERAVAARPNDLQTLKAFSSAARRLERWDTAISAVRRAVLLDPANPGHRETLINRFYDKADYDAAITAAAEAIQRFPEDAGFRAYHAMLVAKHTGDVTYCRKVMDDVPSKIWGSNWRFWSVLYYRGVFADTDEALAWIEAAYPGSSTFAGLYLLVGGDAEGARLRFKKRYVEYFASIDQMSEAGKPRKMGWLGLNAARAGEHEAALEYRELALTHAKTTDDVFYGNESRWAAALILAVLGDVEGAWLEAEPLIRESRGPTEWDLALDIRISYYFADSKGYQALMAKLEAQK